MGYSLKPLTKAFIANHINNFIEITHRNIRDEYWTESHFLSDLSGKWELSRAVLDESENLVGFLIASKKEASVHIHKFVIDVPHQKKGLGKILLNALKDVVTKPLTLKVNADNQDAVSFYLSHGFTIAIEQDKMYT